jgi:hypothetical protein
VHRAALAEQPADVELGLGTTLHADHHEAAGVDTWADLRDLQG